MQKQIVLMAAVVVSSQAARADFGSDVRALRQHNHVVILSDKSGLNQVAVVPEYQGRVMTSTNGGLRGTSFGWINKKAVAENKRQPHINVFGGEDRFWLGPEGGQFSLYFPQGKPFEFKHWQTPAPIDWGGWTMSRRRRESAAFTKSMRLVNYAGTRLHLRANRDVRLLGNGQIAATLGTGTVPAGVRAVAYESDNRITNTGRAAWTKATGMPSIWILGMFNPSPTTTVVVPFKAGSEGKLGPIVNDAYFGKVPATNLKIDNSKGVMFFKADGKKRSKIGLSPRRAKKTLGSYDGKTLTLVEFTLPGNTGDYVNSMWEIQKNPFAGDASNSYNDGPLATGGQLGPFYEIESSSPAAALRPGQTLRHVHRTLHIQGPQGELEKIARRKLGAGLDEIQNALK